MNHYGHDVELGRTWLSSADRERFAAQLQAGINKDEIMDKIRDEVGLEFHRCHILTKKDLENIERLVDLKHYSNTKHTMYYISGEYAKGIIIFSLIHPKPRHIFRIFFVIHLYFSLFSLIFYHNILMKPILHKRV